MSDAELMRYLHDELSSDERAHIDAQLVAAPAVAERLRVLRHRTTRLSALLGAADPSPAQVQSSAQAIRPTVTVRDRRILTRAHWWHSTPVTLRAAAAVVVLLGGVLLVEPARAWVIESVRAAAAAVGLITEAPADAPVAPERTGSGVRFSFPWTGNTIDVDAANARGTIVIRRGSDDRVVAELVNGADAAMVFMPRGIRLEGAGDASAVYSLTLPASVRTLRLTRGGSTADHVLPAGGSELRLPLR